MDKNNAAGVPEGWPTLEMIEAGKMAWFGTPGIAIEEVIRAALAAAPTQQQGQEKCRGCDPAEGFCRQCREAERAAEAKPAGEVLTDLPEPDTHCYDEDTQSDVWSYSAGFVREIVRAALASQSGAGVPSGQAPSAARVRQLIEEAQRISPLSASGAISLTLPQVGYIVGMAVKEAAQHSTKEVPIDTPTRDDTYCAILAREAGLPAHRRCVTCGMGPCKVKSAPAPIAANKAPEDRPSEWTKVTGAGQLKVGDALRFTIGDKSFSERAKLILHAGTDKEEVIYNRKRNFYFITAMVLSGFSNHKNVEFRPIAATKANEEKGQQ